MGFEERRKRRPIGDPTDEQKTRTDNQTRLLAVIDGKLKDSDRYKRILGVMENPELLEAARVIWDKWPKVGFQPSLFRGYPSYVVSDLSRSLSSFTPETTIVSAKDVLDNYGRHGHYQTVDYLVTNSQQSDTEFFNQELTVMFRLAEEANIIKGNLSLKQNLGRCVRFDDDRLKIENGQLGARYTYEVYRLFQVDCSLKGLSIRGFKSFSNLDDLLDNLADAINDPNRWARDLANIHKKTIDAGRIVQVPLDYTDPLEEL